MAMPIRGGIITCNIPDLETLYRSYLVFINNGGLFVPSARNHQIGEEVFVAFTLPGSSERYPLNGKIIWLNAKGTTTKPSGFGIQFGNDINSQKLKNDVDRLLAGTSEYDKPTSTM